MTIRAKLVMAIVVSVTGLALTAGVGIWALVHLTARFDGVQSASDARALALQLKFAVTDFNGWQTAYGYDDGRSRPVFLASVDRFNATLDLARRRLTRKSEHRLLNRVESAAADFMRLDGQAWTALQAGREAEVQRILLGPELVNFRRAATAAQELASAESRQAAREELAFKKARTDALRLLIISAILASVFVAILLVTAIDLARAAERALEPQEGA